MNNSLIFNFTFDDVEFGEKETPWDLGPLLYKGAAAIRVDKVSTHISRKLLGAPLLGRFDLVRGLHQSISDKLACGGSKWSALGAFEVIRRFFRWADELDIPLNLDTIDTTYRQWSDHLLHRIRTGKNISEESAHSQAAKLGHHLDFVLDRQKPIINTTRLRKKIGRKNILGIQADKQNLENTFKFGSTLLDICNGLDLNSIWGKLPLKIHLRNGDFLVEHSMIGKRKWPHPLKSSDYVRAKEEKRKTLRHSIHEADKTIMNRAPLINLRIEAELLIFIGQTGMNLAQAHLLRVQNYSYTSTINGYQVRSYKHRRNGPVLFEIFGEYREFFERYLTWLKAIFPHEVNDSLFPLIRKFRHLSSPTQFTRIKSSCVKLGIPFIPPSGLRKTRVNWLLRRSRDVELTAEMSQHSKETLLNIYEEPSLQVTMTEIARFWQSHDPTLVPPAPGHCVGFTAIPVPDIPSTATRPDCMTPAGCLWCEHHRDIDSFEHVWSLCSYRYLKTLEFSGVHPSMPGKKIISPHPAEHAMVRISDKLQFFKQSSKVREQWVEEGLIRIEEGHYHSDWVGLIEIYGVQ